MIEFNKKYTFNESEIDIFVFVDITKAPTFDVIFIKTDDLPVKKHLAASTIARFNRCQN